MPHATPSRRPRLARFTPALCIALTISCRAPAPQHAFTRNLGTRLSEHAATDRALAASLATLLQQCDRGRFQPDRVAPQELRRHAFFWNGLLATRRSNRPGVTVAAPSVLKSYSFNDRDYYITFSYSGQHAGEPFLRKVVQVKAVPHAGSYRFECLFDERTATMAAPQIDDVTFRHSQPIDNGKANKFVAFRHMWCAQTNTTARPLTYFCFASLEQLLHAYGIAFDCNKCNFLSNDLGFGDDDGARFVTGMGRENNLRDYVYAHLQFDCPEPERMFDAVKEGIAVCYGDSWGGVTLEQMKAKFRRAFAEQPELNWLAEFRKGRQASVHPHFTHYFLCALLCQELLRRDRFDQVLALLYSGPNGEQFFARLHDVLGINEQTFHSSMTALLHQ